MAETSGNGYDRKHGRLPGVKYYERMRELGCFTLQDVTDMVGERSAVAYLVNDYQRKGYIDRIHRNLYAVMDRESGQPLLTRYQIGSRLFPDAYVALYSAFEAWGYAPRDFGEVYVATESRFTDFRYNGVFYRQVKRREADVEQVGGALVTGLEQTVVDSIHNCEKVAGLERIAECIMPAAVGCGQAAGVPGEVWEWISLSEVRVCAGADAGVCEAAGGVLPGMPEMLS